ncbi:PAX-interacting protein 1 [Drosophila grimshawi]|uniref:GH21460 n=1 Tax=Drosophila grimshawi TaxID=7222 RepID=B4JRU0_DROGR|nr:PAX-interacting protein 1 [Drosophila grimshawi]EDV94480.1 GH21460 [Drosophila grimshawi]
MLMPRYSDPDNHKDNSFTVKHGHTSTTVAAHTKMRLLSKVEHNMRQQQQQNQQQSPGQNQSIRKIIHTAATGNGLVGDVDELLTPMRIKAHASPPVISSVESVGHGSGDSGSKELHPRPERNLWSRLEMLEMLNIMQQMNALEQLNDRNVKSEQVFRQIEQVMRSKGHVKKSSIQIWTKWKFLKSTYNTTTRQGNGIPKVVPEEVYRVLCRMLRENASANGSGSGISSECGNSMDSSNAEMAKTLANSDDSKDELGVEHPIFGFCLGLIKPEPVDTGYETTTMNNASNESEQEIESVDFVQNGERTQDATQSSLEHTPFMVSVKNEPEMDLGMDGTNTPPPTAPTSPSPPPPPPLTPAGQLESDNKCQLYPAKSSTTSTSLRVAAFANDGPKMTASTPTHGVLQIERPMPALNRNPLNSTAGGKGNRSMPLQSTSSINFVHPTTKLMLPRKQLPVRFPREISVQPARLGAMKVVPMRETGYLLRPERMIPDLEQSISPPQSPSPPMPKYSIPSYASTSRQAQQQQQQLSEEHNQQQHPFRKRRLQFLQQSPVPVKLQRSSTHHEHKPHGNYRSYESSGVPTDDYKHKLVAEEAQRRKQQQEDLFKKELTQLATAMRSAQKDMLEDFFRQQKIFARREHEFQLKQDYLVMTALRKQTDALLRTAKELMLPAGEEEEEEETAEPQQQQEQDQQQQTETEDRANNMLLLQPEVELLEEQENQENEEMEDMDEMLDEFEENDTQYSDDCNQSDAALEVSTSLASEDASNHSASLGDDAQIC